MCNTTCFTYETSLSSSHFRRDMLRIAEWRSRSRRGGRPRRDFSQWSFPQRGTEIEGLQKVKKYHRSFERLGGNLEDMKKAESWTKGEEASNPGAGEQLGGRDFRCKGTRRRW